MFYRANTSTATKRLGLLFSNGWAKTTHWRSVGILMSFNEFCPAYRSSNLTAFGWNPTLIHNRPRCLLNSYIDIPELLLELVDGEPE